MLLIDLLSDLTSAQREAVTHRDGPLLVLAGAGSGKTRVVTRRVAYLLSSGIAGRHILALTFTNKAAGEMRERIEALVPGSGVWVGTFHGFCARLLRQYAPLVSLDRGFTIYDQADRLRAIKRTLEELGLDSKGVTPDQIEAVISRAKNDMIGPDRFAREGRSDHVGSIAASVYRAYQKRLIESSAVDFDDLLIHIVAILRQHRDVRAHLDAEYRYVLVDEYQDTNLAQYAIARALSVDTPNLCVTGDPDQSIYGWRGANLGNILEFEHDFPGTKIVKLEQNYRSTKNILQVADGLIRFNRMRKAKSLLTDNPTGAPVSLGVYRSELDEASSIAERIACLVHEGEHSFRDVAIFVRVAALTRPIESALRSAKIPYQVVGGQSFYLRQEVKDILAYLHLLLNPKDDVAFERVVNVPPRGIGSSTLERLAQHARDTGQPLSAAARAAESIPSLKGKTAAALRGFMAVNDKLAVLHDHPADEIIRAVLEATGLRSHLAADVKGGGEDRLANVDELVSAARQFDDEHPGATVRDFLEDVSLSTAVDRWNDESGAVALMTLHAAKGLEFPVVFLAALEEGIIPHSRSRERDSEVEEERRLLFVGITRARRALHLSYCKLREFRGRKGSTIASSFLRELPSEPIEFRDNTGYTHSPLAPPDRITIKPPRSAEEAGFRLITAADLQRGLPSSLALSSPDSLRPGLKVSHPRYGVGRIISIEGEGERRKGRVAFTTGGERTFLLASTPFRVLGG
jgi:DNA helicase-2/ATP-dependent DNA helicase PcrA